jgi:hypothetical protein
MTKQEAIQEQIDEIIDNLDLDAIVAVLDLLKSRGRGFPSDWFDMGSFSPYLIRRDIRQNLKAIAAHPNKFKTETKSYFTYTKREAIDEDDNRPFIWLNLAFETERTFHDGTSNTK